MSTMNRPLRFLAFIVAISALGGMAGLTYTALTDSSSSLLQAQVAGGAVFLQGGTITVQPNRQTFLFCNAASRAVPITAPQGTVQIYEFAGYEWALAITQPGAPTPSLFPGRNLTMVNGRRQEGSSSLAEIKPATLYFITSSVSLTINCAAGSMNNAGGVNNTACPIPSCAAPPRDCAWSGGTDANGCPVCGQIVCIPRDTTNATCPDGYGCLIRGSTSPLGGPRAAWECGMAGGYQTEYGQACGTAPDQGVCVRCTATGTEGTTGASGTTGTTGQCVIPNCAVPPRGCFWSGGNDINGCPTCGRLACT